MSLIVASMLALRPVLRNLWEHLPSAFIFLMREIYAQHSGMQGFFKLTSVKILSSTLYPDLM